MWKSTELSHWLLRPGLSESLGAIYDSIWRRKKKKKRTISLRLSLHSSHGAQVWKLGSRGISPVAVYISLIVPASPSSQSIHYLSGYCSSPPSWWWGLTKRKERRKRLLKTEPVEQSVETPPRLDPPVQEHDLLLGFSEACSINTNSLPPFFFSFPFPCTVCA